MRRTAMTIAALLLGLVSPFTAVQAQERGPIRIGFVGELSGPQAPLGQDQYDALMLYIGQNNGKMGGIPVEVIREDSQLKPDVAVQVTQKLIEKDQVSFLTGMTFAPTAAAVAKVATDNNVFAIGSNGSINSMAGEACSPYVFITSFQPEPVVGVLGEYANQQGYKTISMLGPNYVTGKNFLEIFKRHFSGQISDELYTPMAQQDFSAELLQVASSKPDAVFVFYPGGLGINFVRQYQQSGLGKDIPLLAQGALDGTNLPALKDSALGFITAAPWAPDSDNPENKAFVEAFEKKYGRIPTMFAAYSYDAAQLIDSAITKVQGNISDEDGLRAALKAASFPSVRGSFRFNNNHFPIQDYHVLKIVNDNEGRAVRSILTTPFKDRGDPFAAKCPMNG